MVSFPSPSPEQFFPLVIMLSLVKPRKEKSMGSAHGLLPSYQRLLRIWHWLKSHYALVFFLGHSCHNNPYYQDITMRVVQSSCIVLVENNGFYHFSSSWGWLFFTMKLALENLWPLSQNSFVNLWSISLRMILQKLCLFLIRACGLC